MLFSKLLNGFPFWFCTNDLAADGVTSERSTIYRVFVDDESRLDSEPLFAAASSMKAKEEVGDLSLLDPILSPCELLSGVFGFEGSLPSSSSSLSWSLFIISTLT
jgi:hypothetical protein